DMTIFITVSKTIRKNLIKNPFTIPIWRLISFLTASHLIIPDICLLCTKFPRSSYSRLTKILYLGLCLDLKMIEIQTNSLIKEIITSKNTIPLVRHLVDLFCCEILMHDQTDFFYCRINNFKAKMSEFIYSDSAKRSFVFTFPRIKSYHSHLSYLLFLYVQKSVQSAKYPGHTHEPFYQL